MLKNSGLLLIAPMLFSTMAFSQKGNGEISPIDCISPILTSTISYTQSEEAASHWLDMVDESYYKEHKTEVDAAVTTAKWQATANYSQLDQERRQYHRLNTGDISTKESSQYFFNGMPDSAFRTIDKCMDDVARRWPGIYYSVRKNTADEVHLKIFYVGLPGPNPSPLVVGSSTVSNATRQNVLSDEYRVFTDHVWSDIPHKGQLIAQGVKLVGSSEETLILTRDKKDQPVTGTIVGPNFDGVYFDLDPPAKPVSHVDKCSTDPKSLVGDAPYLLVSFPPPTEKLVLDCWSLPVDKNVVVSWNGTLQPPIFPSYSNNQPVSNDSTGVDYAVLLNLVIRDAAGQVIKSVPLVAYPPVRANQSRPLAGSTDPIPVPSNGEVIVSLVVNDSSKWPSAGGPLVLSKDFSVTVATTGSK